MAKDTVLYLNHSAQMSGAEASLRSLLWGLRRADAPIDPLIALPSEGPLTSLLRDEGWSVTLAPLRRLHRPRGLIDTMASLLHVLQTAPHICRLAQGAHAKIIHSNSTTAHLVGGLAGEKTGKPALWHCRDLVPLAKMAPQLSSKATKIVAISNCVADSLERDGVPRDKIRVIFNGIDPDEWRPRERSVMRELLAIPEDAFVFGVMGQLVPWKNHHAFIEAAAKLAQDEGCSHARFVIIGGDLWGEQQSYVNQLRDDVKKSELAGRFNFVPHQSDGADAMAALDCLVHPALDEPFGRVVMEAMAMNKPVIAMNENGPREIVRSEEDGLLVEPEKLAEAMKRVLLDADLREHLSRNARPSVESRFHIADHASKMLELYNELG
ncbi:alpha-D-kanosaminyltransferase [Abditibacteriota bacterium]|nr:alpha-D-kanosaminyltransferase [Abditibacteriota bacterium]